MGLLSKDFWTFKEYLDEKRKLITKPKSERVPDYSGSVPPKPPENASRGKGWEIGVKPPGKPAPYQAPGEPAKAPKPEKGLADEGDKKLKYEPKAGIVTKTGDGDSKPGTWPQAKIPSPATTKSESFLNKTKNMSMARFAGYVRKGLLEHGEDVPTVNAPGSGPFRPDPIQAVRYVAFLAAENENIMQVLLHEARRNNALESMVGMLLQLPETYTELAGCMAADPGVSRSIMRAMHEQVGPPAHQEEEGEEPAPQPEHEPDVGSDEPAPDDEFDMSDEEGGEAPGDEFDMSDEEGGESPGDDDFDMSDEEGGESPGDDDFDMSDEEGDGEFDMGDEEGPPAPEDLGSAVAKHREMQKKMQSYMGAY